MTSQIRSHIEYLIKEKGKKSGFV